MSSANESRYVERLKAVAAVGTAIASVDALDVVLDRIVHETAHVMDVRISSIVLVDEHRTGVKVAAMHGYNGAGSWVPAAEAASWRAITSGRPFEVLDGQIDGRFVHLQRFAQRVGAHTSLFVPMIVRNHTLGSLDIHSSRIRRFDSQDVQLLEILAGQAAAAIENASLYESLEQERRLLATVVEGTEEALILEGSDGQVMWANNVAGRLVSIPADRLAGQTMASVYDALLAMTRDADEMREVLRPAASRHDPFPVDVHLNDPARELRIQIMRVSREEDERPWFLHVFRDVGPEQAADRARRTLLSTVSHELRTPLTNIKGFIGTLLLEDARWDTATQRDFLHEIEAEADHLAGLVSNLLDTSRLEAGVLQVNKRWVNVPALVTQVVDQTRLAAPRHPLSVTVGHDVSEAFVDPERLAEIVRNLVDNAVKYTPAGTPIDVTVLRCEHDLVISVRDQGPGLPDEALDSMFEPFYRYPMPGQSISGTGLGLTICKGLVEAHGGRIWAESGGPGLLVGFSLPLTEHPPGARDRA